MKTETMRRARRGRRVAMVTVLAACAAQGMGAAQSVVTEDDAAAGAAAVDTARHTFAIAAGPLGPALELYRQQSGATVALRLRSGSAADFSTLGVAGEYTSEEALRLLLDGTGLSGRFTTPTVAVVQVQAGETVSVSAGLPDSVSLAKFTQPLELTPQSIDVVPQFVLQDQGVSTLRDTLRNVPGISLAAGEAGAQGDNLTIRGFTARNDIFLDGIRDFGSYYRDSFNYEQVEALEGPSGIAFGRGSTGGVINQESKVPLATPLVALNGQFGTNAQKRVTVDLNEPLDDVMHGTALRLNAMAIDSGVAGRPFAQVRRFGLAPSVTVGMKTATQLTLSYFHLTESDTPDYGLPWFYARLAPGVNRGAYFGFADTNYLRTNDDILTARLEHRWNEHVAVHSIARAANYPRNAQITEPQICANAAVSVPVGGYVSALPTSAVTGAACPYAYGAVDPATILVNRNQIQVKSVESDLWEQTEVTARFRALGTRHELLAGVEGGQETSNPIRTVYTINKLNSVPATTLVNPNTAQTFSGTGYVSSVVHAKAESVGLYFVDTMHLGRHFDLSGGARWDRFDAGYNAYQPTPPAGGAATSAATLGVFTRVDAQPTYRAALVYKPDTHGSVYFSYGTSFNPSAETLALTSTTQNVAPEQNETFEAGAKHSFMKERLLVEGAVFRTEKDNAREADPTNSNNIVVAGNQVVRGVQVSAVGRLPRGMDLVAGYAYLDSAVIASVFYPTSVGYPLANVPRQTFNFFTTQRLGLGFTGGVGGNYVASRTASSTVPYVPVAFSAAQTYVTATGATATRYQVLATEMRQVPGYWVFNAMLRRPVAERVEFQANVNNVLNRFFIDAPHPSHLVPGEGVNAQMGLSYKF